jgi:hypothetical protein
MIVQHKSWVLRENQGVSAEFRGSFFDFTVTQVRQIAPPCMWALTLRSSLWKVQPNQAPVCPVIDRTRMEIDRIVLCSRALSFTRPETAQKMTSKRQIYKVIFLNQGEIYEIYASSIYQSELYGFIEVEEFLFGERAQVVVDPSEERLKNEFNGVQRSFIPMHAVVRIDEVEKEGIAKVTEASGNVAAFPMPFGPGGRKS